MQIKSANDNFIFINKLLEIELKTTQIKRAILDFYKAFNQRAEWVTQSLLAYDELERFEEKLIDEWERLKDSIYDCDSEYSENDLLDIGKKIFYWADSSLFKIRPKVEEPYVCRGTFHILANDSNNRLFWHPLFKLKMEKAMEIKK